MSNKSHLNLKIIWLLISITSVKTTANIKNTIPQNKITNFQNFPYNNINQNDYIIYNRTNGKCNCDYQNHYYGWEVNIAISRRISLCEINCRKNLKSIENKDFYFNQKLYRKRFFEDDLNKNTNRFYLMSQNELEN